MWAVQFGYRQSPKTVSICGERGVFSASGIEGLCQLRQQSARLRQVFCQEPRVVVFCDAYRTTCICLLVLAVTGCEFQVDSESSPSESVTTANSPEQPQTLPQVVAVAGIPLVKIRAGEFLMGSPGVDPADRYSVGEVPVHRVRISRDFYLGKHEITVGQFRQFVNATGFKTEVERNGLGANSLNLETGSIQQLASTVWHSPGFSQSENHPVVCVSWYDAVAFCEWLSVETKRTLRLPTEAEWEYACRSGRQAKFFTGDDPYSLEGFTNMGDTTLLAEFSLAGGTAPWSDGSAFPCQVGMFKPNAFGLYDMHGNVGEWCQDWYSNDYYQNSPDTDPTGPASPSKATPWHSVRGGSWFNSAHSCRASGRHDAIETAPSTTNGFRIVMEIIP